MKITDQLSKLLRRVRDNTQTIKPNRNRLRRLIIEQMEKRRLLAVLDLAALTAPQGFIIFGAEVGDQSGRSVSNAGDVNGDGFDDLIIGAAFADASSNAKADAGDSYVIFGGSAMPPTVDLATLGTAGITIFGADADDQSGRSVSSAGDVNGDGFDDLLIGASLADASGNAKFAAGESYVILGGSSLPASIDVATLGTAGITIFGADAIDYSGRSVSSAGDVNGDGFDDLLIGSLRGDASSNAKQDAGDSYVIFGGAALPATIDLATLGTAGITIFGADANDFSGFSVSSAGDVNGDGFDDLIIGAYLSDALSNAKSVAGDSYVIFGASLLPVTIDLATLGTAGTTIFGAEAYDQSGISVSSAGDVNGDGFDDLLVSARAADASDNAKASAGDSYVIFGASSLPATIDLATLGTAGITIFGADANDFSGFSVSSAGDVNGDGFDDLLIGAYLGDASSNAKYSAGESYVIFGRSAPPVTIDLASLGSAGITIFGVEATDRSGISVSSAGDVNGDGFDDLIIGAFLADAASNLKSNAGESYVIFGGDFTAAITHQGTTAGDTLTGTGAANVMIGGRSNDTLIGNGGADVLTGGQGSDVLAVSDLTFQRIVGGTGSDTLRLDGSGLSLNLTALADNRLLGIEQIDITGSGDNTLTLNQREVLNLSDESNILIVRRNAGDVVNMGSGWTQGANETIGLDTFNVFTQGVATLKVQSINNVGPSVAFNLTTSSGNETSSPVSLAVSLSTVYGQTVTVAYAVTGGSATGSSVDYTLANGTLTFAPGETQKLIPLTIVNDSLNEANESIQITLSSPTNAALGGNTVHTYTIIDNDVVPTVGFTTSNSSGSEATSPVSLAVFLSNASGQTVAVAYAVTGTATSGVDYILSMGTLSFAPGETTKNISLTIIDDDISEASETIQLTLSNPTNSVMGTTTHTYTISDNDMKASLLTVSAQVVNGVLQVEGTTATDVINLRQTSSHIEVYDHSQLVASFTFSSISSIEIHGRDGDDQINLAFDADHISSLPARLYGHAGNDSLIGGNGNDLLDGGAGFNQLNGGQGINQLIDNEKAVLRPTLLVVVHGFELYRGEALGVKKETGDGTWSQDYAKKVAVALEEAGSPTTTYLIDWNSTSGANVDASQAVADEITRFVNSQDQIWDVFFFGHSRGAVFLREVGHKLGHGPAFGSLHQILLDPTGADILHDLPGSASDRVQAKVYDDERALLPGVTDGITVIQDADYVPVYAQMRDYPTVALNDYKLGGTAVGGAATLAEWLFKSVNVLGTVSTVITYAKAVADGIAYHVEITPWYLNMQFVDSSGVERSYFREDVAQFIAGKSSANSFATQTIDIGEWQKGLHYVIFNAGDTEFSTNWRDVLSAVSNHLRYAGSVYVTAGQGYIDGFISLMHLVADSRDKDPFIDLEEEARVTHKIRVLLIELQKISDNVFTVARHFGDITTVALNAFTVEVTDFLLSQLIGLSENDSVSREDVFITLRDAMIGIFEESVRRIMEPFAPLFPGMIDVTLNEDGVTFDASFHTPHLPGNFDVHGVFNDDGSITVQGNAELPVFGNAELTGSIQVDGSYSLAATLGSDWTVGRLSSSAFPTLTATLSNTGLHVAGSVNLPAGLASGTFSGSIEVNGSYSLIGQLNTSKFGISLGTLTISNNGATVGATLPILGLGATLSVSSTELSGSVSTTKFKGISFGTLTINSSGAKVTSTLPIVGLTTTLSVSSTSFSGNVSSSKFGVSFGTLTISSSGASVAASMPGIGDFKLSISSSGISVYLNKGLAGATLYTLSLSTSGVSISAWAPHIGNITLDVGTYTSSSHPSKYTRLSVSLNLNLGVFKLRTLRLYSYGDFSVEAYAPAVGTIWVSGSNLSNLSTALSDRLPKISIDGPKVGGVAGKTGNTVATTFKKVTGFGGITAGAVAFFDANKNGLLDTYPPEVDFLSEPWTFTNYQGEFLAEVPAEFDKNRNGVLDDEDGQWVVVGGVYSATGLPAGTVRIAPGSWNMVTPVTTLVATLVNNHSLTTTEASSQVLRAMGLPDLDLASFQPMTELLSGNPVGAEVYIAHARLNDSIAQITALHAALNGSTPQELSRVIMDVIANQIMTSTSAVDFGDASIIESVVRGVGTSTGQVLAEALIAGASSVIADANRQFDALDPMSGIEFIRQAEQIKLVSQGAVAQKLSKAATGELDVAAVVESNTGDALVAQIMAAVIPPTLLVPDVIIAEATSPDGAQVELTVAANDIAGQSLTVTLSHASGSTFALGDTIVTASTTDSLGNTVNTSFSVTVVDTKSPELNPVDLFIEASGSDGASVTLPTLFAADLVDSNPLVTYDISSGIFPLGTTSVMATATDASGNTRNTSFTVTVADTTAPLISVPADRVVEATEAFGVMVTLEKSTASDLVDASPLVIQDFSSGFFQVGTTVVSITAIDASGNTSVGSFTVTVLDTTPPVLSVPQDLVIEANAPGGALAEFLDVTATDQGDPNPLVTYSVNFLSLGTTLVSATATDASGNSTSASFTVTVIDTTPPELSGPTNLFIEADVPGGAIVTYSNMSVTDLADPNPVVAYDVAAGFFPLGTTPVTVSATDASGNSNSFTILVTVVDTTAPALSGLSDIIVQTNVEVGAQVTLTQAVVTDVADPSPVVVYDTSSGLFPLGTTLVTVRAADASGNVGSFSFAVTVVDPASGISVVSAITGIDSVRVEGTAIAIRGRAISTASLNIATGVAFNWEIFKDGAATPFAGSSGIDQTDYYFTPDDNGEYRIQLTVTDQNGGSATTERTIQVANQLPQVAFSYELDETTIHLTGLVQDPSFLDTQAGFTYVWNVIKDGESFAAETNQNGEFSFTPDADGSYAVRLTVTDKDGGTRSVEETISAAAPMANDASVETAEDTPISGTLSANDRDGDSLTYSLVGGPSHGSVIIDSDGSFLYTPEADYHGNDYFTFLVSDGHDDSNLATVSISVAPVNDAPVADDASVVTAEDTPVSGSLSATDRDGDPLAYSLVTGPTNGSVLVRPDGSFQYTPEADFHGEDSFSYQVGDGLANSLATMSISVTSVNDSPVVSDDSVETDEDTPVTGRLLAADVDSDDLIYALVDAPTNGSVAVNPDGSYIYTPDANYQGNDAFTFRASDGMSVSSLATVSITVISVNDVPMAVNGNVETNEDTPVFGRLSATDIEGDALAYALVARPSHGLVVVNIDGSFRYRPDTNFHGSDSFTFRVSDGENDSSLATVSIVVKSVNDAPVAVADLVTTDEDMPLVLTQASLKRNDTDVDNTNAQLIVTSVSNATHGSVLLNSNGTVTFIPDMDFNGTAGFNYTLSDGSLSALGHVRILVSSVNDVPVALASSVTTNEDTGYTFGVRDFGFADVEHDSLASITIRSLTLASGDTLTVNEGSGAVAVVSGMTITAAQIGTLIYKAALNANGLGRSSFSYTVNDTDNGTVAEAMTINVVAVNDKPEIVINLMTITQGHSYVLGSMNISATDVDNTAGQLTYTASGVSGGQFELVSAPGVATSSFTQAQINGGTVKFIHDGGLLAPTYTLKVNDGQLASASSAANVTFSRLPAGVHLINGVLFIIGTDGKDNVELKFGGKLNERYVDVKLNIPGGNGVPKNNFTQTYSTSAFTRVVAYLLGDNDTYISQSDNSEGGIAFAGISQFVFGGDGNDQIELKGLGSSVIVGGSGDDQLKGSDGRNVMIGGSGKDNLKGGKADDLLIAGFTAFDNNMTALDRIFREWNSTNDYLTRVNNLRNGTGAVLTGSSVKLQRSGTDRTVFSDSSEDDLKGDEGLDWYFADLDDKLHGKISGEILDLITN